MSRSSLAALVSALLLALVIGPACGPTSSGPKTYPVSGTVTLKGQPVDGATVTFQAADGKGAAVGTTDSSGNYALTAGPWGRGAAAGEYRVSVVKFKAAAPEAPAGTGDNYVPPDPNKPPPPPPENELPAKYADAKNSGLTASVKESGDNKFDLKLE